jgi:hypothetical protein
MTGAEVSIASAATTLAIAVLSSYLLLRPGWHVPPLGILVVSLGGGMAIGAWLGRDAGWRASELSMVAAVTVGVAAILTALAWPSLLPVGGGPDLTHHLVLINYLERHWQLAYRPDLVPYLGDMLYYTPGSHLLIALAGAWTRSDGLHVVHSVLVVVVAIKIAFVFAIARRVLGTSAHPTTFAVAAVVLLFLPYEYVVGSFAHDAFWAQVVAETFACAAWWGLAVWDDEPSLRAATFIALFGAATFITWPIWIGPIVVALVVVVAVRGETSLPVRITHLVVALAPIAVVAAVHMIGRLGWLRMAATSGAVIRPSPAIAGWTFVVLAAVGLVLIAVDRRGRVTIALLAATLVQSLALFAVARMNGADTPYLALKMMYLVPYPLAIAAARTLAEIWRIGFQASRVDRYAWVAVLLVGAAVARRDAALPRPHPIVTETTYQAGRWVRDHVDPACVDYLVADGYTGYWLHLAVLDNPRNTARMTEPATFEPHDALARWIETDGLPFAIVDDVRGFSSALFTSTDTLAEFGPSRVIKRHGRAICP